MAVSLKYTQKFVYIRIDSTSNWHAPSENLQNCYLSVVQLVASAHAHHSCSQCLAIWNIVNFSLSPDNFCCLIRIVIPSTLPVLTGSLSLSPARSHCPHRSSYSLFMCKERATIFSTNHCSPLNALLTYAVRYYAPRANIKSSPVLFSASQKLLMCI